MRVRTAVPGDEGRLRSVRLQALGDSPEAFASTLAREAGRSRAAWEPWIATG